MLFPLRQGTNTHMVYGGVCAGGGGGCISFGTHSITLYWGFDGGAISVKAGWALDSTIMIQCYVFCVTFFC